MTETLLRLAASFTLPIDAVTETFAIIAKRRVGKSNLAVVMAEQMYHAGIPWVAIDPKGDWWGVRSSANGKQKGLAVIVFGGSHGDVPLLPDSGAYMADLIATRRLTCVLDISEWEKGEQIRFLLAFATRLLKVNRDPLHLFLEECDDYIPQNVFAGDKDEMRVVRAFSRLVRHGGFKGIGATFITQRAALLSKNVLSQVETMFALRTTHPPDIKQVSDWIKGHPLEKEIITSLSSQKVGAGWALSPAFLGVVEHIPAFDKRQTFDSGRTPKMGEARVEPTRLADVDLAVIEAEMASIIERAKESDPKALQAEVARLRKQVADLDALTKRMAETKVQEVKVEVQVVPPVVGEIVTALGMAGDELGSMAKRFIDLSTGLAKALEDPPKRTEQRTSVRTPQPAQSPKPLVTALPRRDTRRDTDGDTKPLSKAQRLVLSVLAQYSDGRDQRRLAALAGYSDNKAFANVISECRVAGWVTGSRDRLTITQYGLDIIDGQYEPLPSGDALYQKWLGDRRIGKAERAILEVLHEAWPGPMSAESIAPLAGYEANKSFSNNISRLRTLDLIEGDRFTIVIREELMGV